MINTKFSWWHKGYDGQKKALKRISDKAVGFGLKAVMRTMRQSMKDAKRGLASRPGSPPHAHRRPRGTKKNRRRLKDTIAYGLDASKQSGVVGPAAKWANKVGHVHEFGKSQYIEVRYGKDEFKKRRKKGRLNLRGYSPEAADKGNKYSQWKRSKGLRPMEEKEIKAIQEYYENDKHKYKRIKMVTAKYPKRPFAKKALLASLAKITASLRGNV